MNIALIGGHGKVAFLAASLLVAAGHTVTSFIRNPDHAVDVARTGATPRVLDVEILDQAGWNEVLAEGFDAVVWSDGAGSGSPERTWAVDVTAAKRSIAAAVRADITRYVMVSYASSTLHHEIPLDNSFWHYTQAKAEADTFLRGTELDYVILGPTTLTLDDPTGAVELYGEIPADRSTTADLPCTSRANVAQMILAAVEAPPSQRRSIAFADGSTPIAEVFGS